MYTLPEHSRVPSPSIGVVYAGGTISSLATEAGHREGGHIVDLLGHLEQHQPQATSRFAISNPVIAYTGLSENITRNDWIVIETAVENQLDKDVSGVVITHGTDSMEQTARYLQRRLGNDLVASDRKVILTGANDDISVSTTDAWENLAFALDSTQLGVSGGVYVAFHGRLIPADLVIKEPFNGEAMNYASMQDPAYIAAKSAVGLTVSTKNEQLMKLYGHTYDQVSVIDYPVNVVRDNHDNVLEYIGRTAASAVLLTLYHSGTAHTKLPDQSVARLTRTIWSKRGIPSFAVTENGEAVNFGNYETSVKLEQAGIVGLGTMEHAVALTKLRLASMHFEPNQLAKIMQQDDFNA